MSQLPLLSSFQLSANCSLLFADRPLLQRAAAAKASGFDAVEFWWPFPVAVPPDRNIDAFVRSMSDEGVQLAGLNFFAGDLPAGDRGIVSWPGRSHEFQDNVDVVAAIAASTGCQRFNALYGNRLEAFSPQAQDEVGLYNLAYAASVLSCTGGVVLLEAVSGPVTYPLRTAAQVLSILDSLEEAGTLNTGLLLDVYHLASNGDDVAAVIERHGPAIAHVQFADAPGRHEPGSGSLPFLHYLSLLEASGYQGHVALEYLPQDDTESGLAWITGLRQGLDGRRTNGAAT
jgi:hydroxypyruvate isomerase